MQDLCRLASSLSLKKVIFSFLIVALVSGCSEAERYQRERAIQEETLRQQQAELDRQDREREDIERQELHNRRMERFSN